MKRTAANWIARDHGQCQPDPVTIPKNRKVRKGRVILIRRQLS